MAENNKASPGPARSVPALRYGVVKLWTWLEDVGRRLVAWLVGLISPGVFNAIAIAALTYVIGPRVVEGVKTTLERDRLQHQLITQILKDTENLDPRDARSVVRLGVIAEIVKANRDLFGVDMGAAADRLDQLSRELNDGALAVIGKKLEDSKQEVAVLEKAKGEAVRQRDAMTQMLEAQRAERPAGAAPTKAEADARRTLEILQGTIAEQDRRIERLRATNTEDEARTRKLVEEAEKRATGPAVERLGEQLLTAKTELATGAVASDALKERLETALRDVEALKKDRKIAIDAAAQAQADAAIARSDLRELRRAKDKLEQGSKRIAFEEGERLRLIVSDPPKGNVTFNKRSAVLTPTAQEVLSRVACYLQRFEHADYDFQIGGFADRDPGDNWKLSVDRALNVRRFLQSRGVEPQRMSVAGYGDVRPKTTTGLESADRRVEVAFVPHGPKKPSAPVPTKAGAPDVAASSTP